METARVLFDEDTCLAGHMIHTSMLSTAGCGLPHSSRNATTGSIPMALRAGR